MNYDFVILGGGSAGYAAARTAVQSGLRTAVIEGGEEVGGLCILQGCMPSKTLIEITQHYRTLRRAKEFGLRAEKIGWSAPDMIARKRTLISEFAADRQALLETGKFDFIRGMASFLDDHMVLVRARDGTTQQIEGSAFLIATGSVIQQPPLPGLADTRYLTSDDVLDLEKLPSSITVLGAGPVALELAHYLEGLGIQVVIIQRGPQLLTGIDIDAAEAIRKAGEDRGIRTHVDTQILDIRTERNGTKTVRFRKEGETYQENSEELLVALGRRAAISGLGLEAAGIQLRNGCLAIDPTQQTSKRHIFAAGDACGPYEIVHIAIQQGEIAARNASKLLTGTTAPLEEIDYRLYLYVVFTEPEAAFVGLSEREAQKQKIPFVSARHPFNDHGKSMLMGETEGFVKLLASPTSGEILGGAVVGPHASDLIHEIAVAMYFHATVAQLANIPHYHPTLSEIWSYPAEELSNLN